MTADDMKAIVCCYWRFIRHCPYVATEISLGKGYTALCPVDVLALNRNLYVIETEVKVSIADMRKELTKAKYRQRYEEEGWKPVYEFPDRFSIAKYFYFAVPEAIADKAQEVVAERYKGAGLLVVKEPPEGRFDTYRALAVDVAISPKQKPGAKPLSDAAARILTQRIANQMCRSMVDAANARRGHQGVQTKLFLWEAR